MPIYYDGTARYGLRWNGPHEEEVEEDEEEEEEEVLFLLLLLPLYIDACVVLCSACDREQVLLPVEPK